MSEAIQRVTITGRVQMVGYRDWTVRNATELGLQGWVRNRDDGSVEAVFAGPADVVARMIERCRRGPGHARVDRVDAHDAGAEVLNLRKPGETFSQLK